jgi:hypothetical protein
VREGAVSVASAVALHEILDDGEAYVAELSLIDGNWLELRGRRERQGIDLLPQLLLAVSEVAVLKQRAMSLVTVVPAK